MPPSSSPSLGPRTWREVADIPGFVSNNQLEAAAGEKSTQYDGRHVEIRWRRSVGLDWSSYRLVHLARVYGETHLLLEKPDASRSWSPLREIGLFRLLP